MQGKARGGEEESALMHDLKPFRILISLLDKPELGKTTMATTCVEMCFDMLVMRRTCHTPSLFSSSLHLDVFIQALQSWRMSSSRCFELCTRSVGQSWIFKTRVRLVKTTHTSAGQTRGLALIADSTKFKTSSLHTA